MNIVYLTRDGIMEALGTSQVLAYMLRLSKYYSIKIISFEKTKDLNNSKKLKKYEILMKSKGIQWMHIKYAKNKYMIALDFLRVLLKINDLNDHNATIIHCRSFIPGIIGFLAKKLFNIRYIYDIRGFWIDERYEAMSRKKRGIVYKVLYYFDKKIYSNASHIISLTEASKKEIIRKEYKRSESISVIPTCVDLELFSGNLSTRNERETYDLKKLNIYYIGSVQGRQRFDAVIKFLIFLQKYYDIHLIILNNGELEFIENSLKKINFSYEIHDVDYWKVNQYLTKIGIAVFFYDQTYSRIATSPTKMGEFLAQGIPCITNSCVGDSKYLLEENEIGFTLDIDSDLDSNDVILKIKKLISDVKISKKCRDFAEFYYSLEAGSESYREVYEKLKNHI